MAKAALRPAALLVLTALAIIGEAHEGDETADEMMQRLENMKKTLPQHSQHQQGRRDSVNQWGANQWGASAPTPPPYAPPVGDQDWRDTSAAAYRTAVNYGATNLPTVVPTNIPSDVKGFLANSSPKNRAIITGVVAGGAVSAVAGGIAIAIEESKINKRLKEGKEPKPLFPFLKAREHGASLPAPPGAPKMPDWLKPGPTREPPDLPDLQARIGDSETTREPREPSARVKEEEEEEEEERERTEEATRPPTTSTETTTTAGVLGDEIPLPVWIALAVLACCCLAALICACVEAMRHSGQGHKKRSVTTKKRDAARTDSASSYDEDSYYRDQYSEYSGQSPNGSYAAVSNPSPNASYAAVSPQDYYDNSSQLSSQFDYSQYSQQDSYQTAGLPSYTNYADGSTFSAAGSLASTPHPNAHSYVHEGVHYYNTGT